MGRWSLDTSPAYLFADLMSRVLSPYDLNPLGYNPLREILAESIDFERLAGCADQTLRNGHAGADRSRANFP